MQKWKMVGWVGVWMADNYPQPLGLDMMGVGTGSPSSGVTVYETKKVDIYDIAVLGARDTGELKQWLQRNGYEYPSNREHLLESYVGRGWYFVAVRVDNQAQGYAGSFLYEGHATPLRMTFAASKIVYPLKISGPAAIVTPTPLYAPLPIQEITSRDYCATYDENVTGCDATSNCAYYYCSEQCWPRGTANQTACPGWSGSGLTTTPQSVNMVLYVFTGDKQTAPGWNTEYAGYVPAKEIEKMAIEDSGEPWMKTSRKMYLTNWH